MLNKENTMQCIPGIIASNERRSRQLLAELTEEARRNFPSPSNSPNGVEITVDGPAETWPRQRPSAFNPNPNA